MHPHSVRFTPSLLLLMATHFSLLTPHSSLLAQTPSVPLPSTAPLDLARLNQPKSRNNGVRTDSTISQRGLTIPSLWWAKEQFGDYTLENWLAYPGNGITPGRVDLIVNQQSWSSLDYIQRYEFVNHFGTVARDYGYNIRIFNSQKQRLATYTCNFSTTPRLCNIQLDATGNAIVRGST